MFKRDGEVVFIFFFVYYLIGKRSYGGGLNKRFGVVDGRGCVRSWGGVGLYVYIFLGLCLNFCVMFR